MRYYKAGRGLKWGGGGGCPFGTLEMGIHGTRDIPEELSSDKRNKKKDV